MAVKKNHIEGRIGIDEEKNASRVIMKSVENVTR